ncbi:toll/interleukin-1 receptor domain-containing protein [Leptolyngbya sp. AN03gr2]|uniref:toll/interleukin-1 receptor domain-containing protein n=1 Tax=unclassified Leptolyngbya TaxID=2650499 RepID=UPI003D3230EE
MITSVYIAYDDTDENLRDELKSHLSSLIRRKLITLNDHRSVPPGREWQENITHSIESAKIILLLCSSSFFNNDWCYEYEIKRAVRQHEAQQSIVIPILVRPFNLSALEDLRKLQWLPPNGVPITSWKDRDAAWVSVTQDIETVIYTILTQAKV